MDPMLDTLAASRKLEDSGMPEPQADAVVEVVNEAMNNLVTKEYLKFELERSFNDFERKMDKHFEKIDTWFDKIDTWFDKIDKWFDKIDERFDKIDERFENIETNIGELRSDMMKLHVAQSRGVATVCVVMIAAMALLFSALQYFG